MLIYKFKDTEISQQGNLIQAFSKIYGLGLSRVSFIMQSLGFERNYKMGYLNRFFYNCIIILIKNRYILLDYRLKEVVLQRMEFFYANSFVKGLRLFDGLPVRGQRTHTNGSTPEVLKPFSEKYNVEIVERQKRILSYAKKRKKKK